MNFNHECRLNAKIIFPFLLSDLRLQYKDISEIDSDERDFRTYRR